MCKSLSSALILDNRTLYLFMLQAVYSIHIHIHILPGAPDLLTEFFEPLCEVLTPIDTFSDGYVVPNVSSSPRFEEKTRSREGNFSMHSTLDTGKQLNLI